MKNFIIKHCFGRQYNPTHAQAGVATLIKKDGKISIDFVCFSGKAKESGKEYTITHEIAPQDEYSKEIVTQHRNPNYPDKFVYTYQVLKDMFENDTCNYEWHTIEIIEPVKMKDEKELGI